MKPFPNIVTGSKNQAGINMPNKCLENISDVLFWKDMVKVKLTLRLIN
jgi:hypothetical protein